MTFLGGFLNARILFVIFIDVKVQEMDDIHVLLNQWKVYTINMLLFIASRLILIP